MSTLKRQNGALSQNMRVAFFTETFLPKVDGIVTVICLLLDHLAERGVESILVAPRLSEKRFGKAEPYYADTRIIRPFSIPFPIYDELRLGLPTVPTYRQLKAFDPDIVHIIHPAVLGVAGILMAKRLNLPILASFHLDIANMAALHNVGFLIPLVNFVTSASFNQAAYSLAPSRRVQRQMIEAGVKNVGLWGRGVDAEQFHPKHRRQSMREMLSDGHVDDKLLLYVGRLSPEKQIPHLKHILERVPNTRLAIIGDGPQRKALEAIFEDTPTKFMGYMHGDALYQAYASADVFVFPSALESFGLVVTEAMAAGLPVVASRVGGVTDIVSEGVTGYTFEPADIESMIDGVCKIIANPDTMRDMGQRARAFAETQTWPAMMDEVIEHYARMIADHRRS